MAALNVAWRRSVIAVAVLLGFFGFTLFFFPATVPEDLHGRIPFSGDKSPVEPAHAETSADDLSFINIVRALWKPLAVDITQKSFTDREGNVHTMGKAPYYTKKLGKKLVILDVDTRPLDKEGEVNAPEAPTWENLHHLSAGIMSHYLYAKIHGYDYKFIRSPEYDYQQGGWTKVLMSHELMKSYDWVVTVDSDAEFTSPELPLEWMMNYWNFTSKTAIAMANDPAGEPNFDSKHNVVLNTGFFFSQAKAPKVEEIYKKWGDCTTGKEYEECTKWTYESFREQTAFSEHIRYDFPEEGVIVALPCAQANGFPEAAGSGCTGQFLKHFWTEKNLSKRQLADGIMQAVVPQLYSSFKDSVVDWHMKSVKGNEIW
ncbi:hypothetical protein EJ05DRAFT_486945 [Pseudovirgaria hyperparasitica]|uniref:Nucleotide-diphospho-sugar transferase domain-containing protein n=1 Tax=Pseudovirgaria hyperparasitica TaxID=470096 RepID=A0A6A6W4Q3_9PEZI|nr:uncharacterized protein EJ05DRAFT_486945 [Pseudovirgaria hyperparasitica]KAF2756936.1 hypothetical protein EJ05DRAFT_486945 [Pseudovirgaria hyperparasitica]